MVPVARQLALHLFLFASLPGVVTAKDSFRIEYFEVRGTTAADLREDLRRVGPVGENGVKAGAITKYRIAWKILVTFDDESCRAGDVTVDLEVTMQLPRWEQPAHASPEVVQIWDRISALIRRHEDGHHHIAIEAAREVRRELGKPVRAASCDALKAALDDTANAVLREYRRKQADYDQRTDFGRDLTSGLL